MGRLSGLLIFFRSSLTGLISRIIKTIFGIIIIAATFIKFCKPVEKNYSVTLLLITFFI